MNATKGGILSLTVKDKAQLYSAYIPFVRNGGIFVPTPKRYFLGDEVFVLLTLPESSERLPVAGKVIWVTPVGAQGARTAGIGVRVSLACSLSQSMNSRAAGDSGRWVACTA